MELDFVSALLGALLTIGVFSGLIIRDASRPRGRRNGQH